MGQQWVVLTDRIAEGALDFEVIRGAVRRHKGSALTRGPILLTLVEIDPVVAIAVVHDVGRTAASIGFHIRAALAGGAMSRVPLRSIILVAVQGGIEVHIGLEGMLQREHVPQLMG